MSGRRGFALLTVLWLLTALTVVAGGALAAARLGQGATANRVALTRGRWGAEACLAIAQGRRAGGRLADTATVDLGQGVTCRWTVTDPTARLNVNAAEREELEKLSGAVVAERIVEVRRVAPFQALEEVAGIPGVDSGLVALLGVDGPGVVNANAAPPAVLAALAGLGDEAIDLLRYRREVGRPIRDLDALAGGLSPGARAVLLAHYAHLARRVVFAPPVLRLTAQGWVAPGGGPERLHATIELLVVPLPDRLAVVRRRMW